ncbi:MAG: energy-coupling factor ABC transporter ATP-binding protein [Desulfarculales bacterium]|jgi:energy-coupling factor transport system ATP-binding protein|nr:energy-coupling factor ABC transporter ATP-binding protein [Desulfarculales bacterium]
MLRLAEVSFGLEGERIISKISFTLGQGEFAALLGENGAGKSTLCRLSMGLLKPAAGRVLVCGQDTAAVKTSAIARQAGFLFQNPDRQICRPSVAGEIMLGLELTVPDPAERERRCRETLALFSLDPEAHPFNLSRGERQLLALASVLAPGPRLLILDEPTTGLDYRECMTVMEIIARRNREGATVLMVSHDMEVASDFARRVLVLNRGELAGDGPVREIMRDQALLQRASLLPPQIPALALSLGGQFAAAFTIEEMAALAANSRRGRL